MFYVYIIKSLRDNGYYVGLTNNINGRLSYHNAGKVRSTKARIPFKIMHTEEFKTRLEARAREKYLKSYRGSRDKLTILENL